MSPLYVGSIPIHGFQAHIRRGFPCNKPASLHSG